jgi:hypothetical protein
LISRDERDEALRIAMFHQFEQGAAGDRVALAMELALGFDEWSQPALHQARLRGVELELRLLREARKISLEQMEYLEASVVRGLLTREELDRVRTATYLELRFGPTPRPKEAEELAGYSSDSVWLERLPQNKPCWIGDLDLAGKLRTTLGEQAKGFGLVAEAIIDWLPLYPEASQVRPAFDELLLAFESKNPVSHRALEKLRSLPKEVVSVGLCRASPIIDAILLSVRRTSPPVARRRTFSARRARSTSDSRARGSAFEGVVRR